MKKMLVPFDEKYPGKKINDFIYPHVDESGAIFIGIKKSKRWAKGMAVYTGIDITANDLFAKIVDAGNKIDSVDDLINDLHTFIAQLHEFSIGNIIEIEKDEVHGFRLKKFVDRIQTSGTSKIP